MFFNRERAASEAAAAIDKVVEQTADGGTAEPADVINANRLVRSAAEEFGVTARDIAAYRRS